MVGQTRFAPWATRPEVLTRYPFADNIAGQPYTQMAGHAEIFPIGMDTSSIEPGGIPDSGSSDKLRPAIISARSRRLSL
ncbi:hypothetical protein LMG28727_06242 [Paraburkholderia kirstenboschensis]|nr:hypothetical protein LMG28727_06242 [Paraburkholderia kirstenboschensis]